MAVFFSLFCLLFLTSFKQPLQVQALAPAPDYCYMKSVNNATDLPATKEYDYIVVGGGTAGCPLAATLSEKYSVLIFERGDVPRAHPNTLHLGGFFANLMQEDDGSTPAQRFTSEDGVDNARGRVLGGSSMINAGFFSRAEPGFYERSGVEWDMGSVQEAYRWVEEALVSRPELVPWQSAVREALLDTGVLPDNGFSLDHLIGTKISGSTFDRSGQRHGAVELLNRGDFKNLHIAVHATVEKIIFSTAAASKPTAIGVVYTDSNGESHRALVRGKGEVILSAGSIGSPQLLMLSGIGPPSDLSSLRIPVILSQPNVGQHMVDNPRNNINLVLPFRTDPSSVQVVGITKDYYFEAVSSFLPFSSTPFPFGFYTRKSSIDLNMALLAQKLSDPLSRGSLSLASNAGVKTAPSVRFNYYDDPADLEFCVSAMRNIGEMLETGAMERFKHTDSEGDRDFWFYGEALPANTSDNSAMREFCQSTVTTIWHYHGGCVVGKVVDGDYRVIGADSLRVVDGSTFATSPGTNPQATLMMLGRYLGVKMLRERRDQSIHRMEGCNEITELPNSVAA